MALIKCKECHSEVSEKATACPKCGAPVPKKKMGKGGIILVGFFIFVGIAALADHKDKGGASQGGFEQKQSSADQACAKDDLSCLGNKGVIGASVYCPRYIEQLAKHTVKWTDGTFDLKFSRFRWSDKAKGVITYIGDKAEFQNGFGAYTNVIYQCDLASDGKTVLDARVIEGRLPPD